MTIQLVTTPAGNFARLGRALDRVGARARLREPAHIDPHGGPMVLAGVSSFSTLCDALQPARGRIDEFVRSGRPVLGVCAGMQVMFETSEEGPGRGLALFPGRVRRLRSPRGPNLGWSRLNLRGRSRVLAGVPGGSYAYFAHSYRVPARVPGIGARATFRGESFPAVVERGNVWGVQFHPELSGAVGRRVLENFLAVCREGSA
jgi:imidazole glycerol-phosphate synthase subunit HisH